MLAGTSVQAGQTFSPQINNVTWLKAKQTATFVILLLLLLKCLMLQMHHVINDPAHHC
jgi:hypothetical protein